MDVYRACKEEGAERVLSIHISSEMSGTWQGAKLAADMVKDEIAVEVVDSRTVTIGLGLNVVTIARFIRNHPDASWDEVMAHVRAVVEKTPSCFCSIPLTICRRVGASAKPAISLARSSTSSRSLSSKTDSSVRTKRSVAKRSRKPSIISPTR